MARLIHTLQPHFPSSAHEWLGLILVVGATVAVTRRAESMSTALLMGTVGVVGYVLDAHLYLPVAVLLAMTLTVVHRRRRPAALAMPRPGARALGTDLALAGAGFLLYELGRIVTQGAHARAVRNGEWMLSLERALGLPREAAVQAFVLESDRATQLFNRIYSFYFLAPVLGALVWLSFNDPRSYRFVRNGLGLSALLSVATFALFPVAPPRLTPLSGLVDSHARVGLHHSFVNQFAAVPSLHVGWMFLVGWGLARSIGGWRGVLVGSVPGTATWFTVVVTGNHYWLDGVAGMAVTLAPVLLLERWGDRRSRARDAGRVAVWSPVAVDPCPVEYAVPVRSDASGWPTR